MPVILKDVYASGFHKIYSAFTHARVRVNLAINRLMYIVSYMVDNLVTR